MLWRTRMNVTPHVQLARIPDDMPVLVEQYVVVGGKTEAQEATQLWRFGPKGFKTLYNVRDPAEIQRRAEMDTPIEQVVKEWPISTDPGPHHGNDP